MKMRSWCRRALAFSASFLFVALLFVMPADAEIMSTENVFCFPITIHDYAADGMLFEWNDLTGTGEMELDGKTVHQGNNQGFGLLTSTEDSHQNLLTPDTIEGSTLQSCGEFTSTETPEAKEITLSNKIKETIYGGTFRTGLVEPVLGPDKKPVYRKETVDFLADYLSATLPEELTNEDGSENLWHVMGTELDELGGTDLADILRQQIISGHEENPNKGTYDDSKAKAEAFGLQSIYDVTTYYDAAYFLLADLFRDSAGYGKTIDAYNQIMLLRNSEEEPYTFYSGYVDTNYDALEKIISNNQIDTIDSQGSAYGFPLPNDIFDPLDGLGYGNQNHPYQIYLGEDENDDVNHNLTLESHGKFIYHEGENQYFHFTGDDDAYLYINGILVLDMGGSHPIAKAGVEVNALAGRLGLVDGEMYDFDFFYMDRQGKNADFGIETNIRLQNPALVTDIKAFQNQRYIPYDGSVDPDLPVTYQFCVENTSDKPITGLAFENLDLQTMLYYDFIYTNVDTVAEEVLIERRNADGSDDLKFTLSDEEQFQNVMSEGLRPGQKLIIYGINYSIPPEKWWENEENQKEIFPAELVVKGTYEDVPSQLVGHAETVVTKNGYTFAQNHYYDWGKLASVLTEDEKNPDLLAGNDGIYALEEASAGLSISKEDLLKTAIDAGAIDGDTSSDAYDQASIELCSPCGNTKHSANINPHAKLKEDGSVFYQSETTGADTFYYQVVSEGKVVGPIAVDVYTYGVSDNTYVLDYGLPVELYGEESLGLTNNDLLSLASVNPAETKVSLSAVTSDNATYGTFTKGEESLIYQPKKIMNGPDLATVEIQILEAGAECLTPKTGLKLTQTITVVPANIVYYEDDFEGLTYISEDGNAWAMYEGFDENGNSTAGEFQSADQESNYGSDPNYEVDHGGTLTLVPDADGDGESDLSENELARYEETIYGDASNDTIHVLNVQETADVLSFEFAGTGFELVSRTTTEAYSVLSVSVTDTETGEIVKQFPVITECKNGDLYQVPVIRVNDLFYGTYRVTLRAAKSSTTKAAGIDRILYIDGVRIFAPLDFEDTQIYYRLDEQMASSLEMKCLIQEDRALMITRGNDASLVNGSTYIEDVDEYGFLLKETSSVDEYLEVGPNNEIYLNSSAQNNAIMLWLVDIPEVPKSIQIGAHRKCDESTGSFGSVNLVYGGSFDELESEEHVQQIESGTEMYYDIDVNTLKECEFGYLLMIGTTESENEDEVLSLTSLKVSGYDTWTIDSSFFQKLNLADTDEEASEDLDAMDGIARLKVDLYRMLQEKQTTKPTLALDSLKFKNEKVTSGKSATLLAVTDMDTDSIIVLDQDGKEVEFTKNTVKQKDQKKTHTLTWKVFESAGQTITYTVYGTNQKGQVSQKETITLNIQ